MYECYIYFFLTYNVQKSSFIGPQIKIYIIIYSSIWYLGDVFHRTIMCVKDYVEEGV